MEKIDLSSFDYGEDKKIIETKKAFYLVKIERDEVYTNPIDEWDFLGTFAEGTRRYTLGNEKINDIDSFLIEKLEDFYTYDFLETLETEELFKRFSKYYIYQTVYMYNHSCITISCSPFSCPWDSGMIGVHYISKEKARKKYGKLTKKTVDEILSCLEGEIKTIDNYLTGNIYWYGISCIEKESENSVEPEEIEFEEFYDSCGGFYGDHEKSGILEYIESNIEYHDNNLSLPQLELKFDLVASV